ncbi:MAG: c-type cytochrome domain-containing protein, partial [bacterium]
MLAGGDSGPAAVAGNPAESELRKRLSHADEDVRLPPPEAGPRLSASEIAALEVWIAAGLPWPEELPGADDRAERHRTHWAFQPLPPAPADFADPAVID